MSKSDHDNRSNQLNPNNDSYYQSRGLSGRDDDSDDVGYVGLAFFQNYAPPPTLTQEILSSTQQRILAKVEAEHELNPGMALCAHLRRIYPYYFYRNMGNNYNVVVHVVDCDEKSACAENIREICEMWVRAHPAAEELNLFIVEFLKPSEAD